MLDCSLDKEHSIVLVHPESALEANDFAELAKMVDPQIEANGDLAGAIIDAPHFPGWDSFGAIISHIRFIQDHHKHVKKIAVVTDSHLGDVAQLLGGHLVAAEVRQFPAGQVDQARDWITDGA